MIAMSLTDAARAIGARLHGDDRDFIGLGTDTRSIAADQLFVAIKGEQFDGHDYVGDAATAKAAGALVQRENEAAIGQLICGDSLSALGKLAARWREGRNVRLVGLTGSNGKTTTKAMLAAILSRQHRVLVTDGNFNNEIGMPLTLCQLSDEHEFAVIEMGAGKPGDIRYLAELARPDLALITNAGPAHLLGMGTVDDVARTKGELIEALPEDGVAIINADDDYAPLWAKLAGSRKQITFGLSAVADVRGDYQPGRLHLNAPFGQCDIDLPTQGVHNARNALAAAAVALALEIPLAEIQAGLASFKPVAGRMQTTELAAGWTLIADTYNANPASLRAGIEAAQELPGEHWLVLGDMAELGEAEAALHFQAGAEAKRLGVVRLFCVGDLSRHAAAAFGDGGRYFEHREDLVAALRRDIRPGVVLMIKGSRSMRMEDVSSALQEAA